MSQEMPPFLPELLLMQELEDPRVGPKAVQSITQELRAEGLDHVFQDVIDAVSKPMRERLWCNTLLNISSVVAWDRYRQVYRFSEDMADLLSDGMGHIPAEALDHLPADSVYISISKERGAVVSRCSQGLIITLLYRIVPSDAGAPDQIMGMLGLSWTTTYVSPASYIMRWGGTIEEAFDDGVSTELTRSVFSGINRATLDSESYTDLQRFLGCALYLASQNAEIEPVREPRTAHSKKNRRAFPGRKPCQLHDVGYRVMGAIRSSSYTPATPYDPGHGSPKAPHIRRAHWHTYHHGPKGAPTDTFVKWVPPIAVNSDRGGPDVTIRDIQ